MANATIWYRSSFGELRLWSSRMSTDRSRTLVVHEDSAGDDHVIQDRGPNVVRARCTVLFARMAGDDLDPLERCRRLQEIADDRPRIFSHPTSGSYLARIGPFTVDVDEFGVITAELEVVQIAPVEASAITAAAESLTAELDAVGMTNSLPGDATAAVTVSLGRLPPDIAERIGQPPTDNHVKLAIWYTAATAELLWLYMTTGRHIDALQEIRAAGAAFARVMEGAAASVTAWRVGARKPRRRA